MTMDPVILRHEQHLEVGRLIQRDAQELVRNWVSRAVAEQPAARRAHHVALLDHLPQFLHILGESLAVSAGPDERPHEQPAEEHGEQRWDVGWSLEEVVRDYQILRLVVLEHLEKNLLRPLHYPEIQALGLALDEAITASVSGFVRQREAYLRKLEEERETARLKAVGYQNRWESLFRHAGIGLALTDLGDRGNPLLLEVNEALARLCGEDAANLTGRRLRDLLPKRAWPHIEEAMRKADADGHCTFETEMIMRDGHHLPILAQMMTIPGADGVTVCHAVAIQDIRDRKNLEESLRARANELSLADQHKNEFLGMLAHELRNPLAPILNAMAVLGMSGTSAANAQEARDIIDRQVRLMVRIVDDLLDLTRIAQAKVELRIATFDLSEAVREAVQTTAPLFIRKCHHIDVELPDRPMPVHADKDRIVQILVNLLTNAAKYTNPSGSIRLGVDSEGDFLVMKVRDNGVGIEAGMLPLVFNLFAQAGRSLEQSQGGLGIGLTLVRRLVEMHGGRVAAHSDGPGKGSEFSVWLPAGQTPAPPASVAKPASATTNAPRQILVIEDRADVRNSLATLLTLLGHQVTEAANGTFGLEKAAAQPPQVALIDLGLPDMDGLEVARRLRDSLGPHVRLIALTGKAGEEDRQRCLKAGFNEHLAKPVSVDDLNRILSF